MMRRSAFVSLLIFTAWLAGMNAVFAEPSPPPSTTIKSPPNPLDVLVWDSDHKEQSPQPGQATADFIFSATNSSDAEVVVARVQTSCGCTVAKLPSEPWHIAPHTNGQISVSVNLSGKSGSFTKTITVFSTNNAFSKPLSVKVTMPEDPGAKRLKNQMAAKGDPKAIFKGECASCHVDKSRDKMGKELYVTACGICHEAEHRASMVPDLHLIRHTTDYAFWKQIITYGKPNTMMPGFGATEGGPLTPEQIESLAKVLNQAFPSTVSIPNGRPGIVPPPHIDGVNTNR